MTDAPEKSRKRFQIWLAVIAVPIILLITFVSGLYLFMVATARSIHPDPNGVPSVARSTPPPNWADAIEQGQEIARADLAEQNLPGLSVAVGAGDAIVWAEGFGYADLEKRTTITPATRFRIGNASNALTSAAVGVLLEKQRLNLDAEIQIYVPEFPQKQWPVTLRQLMGHLAGIGNDAGDEEPLLPRCPHTVDALQRFSSRPLLFEPGTRFRPSSYGWILVSAAVEAAAKEPFFTFMHTQIFEPLGMAATRPYVWTESIPDLPTFYYPRFAGDNRYGPELAREGDQSCFAGAGAFLSTPSDLVRFGIGFSSGKLLRPATAQVLQTRQQLTSGQQTDYGLGWTLETVPLAGKPARMAGHDTKQDFIGGTTSLMTFPERALVVAVTSNVSFADTHSVALRIAQAFAQQDKSSARK
jgi:serine beta-lactamase-like protein LACTB